MTSTHALSKRASLSDEKHIFTVVVGCSLCYWTHSLFYTGSIWTHWSMNWTAGWICTAGTSQQPSMFPGSEDFWPIRKAIRSEQYLMNPGHIRFLELSWSWYWANPDDPWPDPPGGRVNIINFKRIATYRPTRIIHKAFVWLVYIDNKLCIKSTCKCFDKLRKTILQNKHSTVETNTRRPLLRWVNTRRQNRQCRRVITGSLMRPHNRSAGR